MQNSDGSLGLDIRVFPGYVAACSVLTLILRGILLLRSSMHQIIHSSAGEDESRTQVADPWTSAWQKLESHILKIGGTEIFVFKVLRLTMTLVLWGVVSFSTVKNGWTWVNILSCLTMVYAVILSFLNLFAPAAVGRMASLHLTLVTFTLFAVYTYRDIWPLMTFTLEVADKDEGSILWVKIALVAFTGVVEPMFEPYPYIPVDHKNPSPIVNAEQTASNFSFLFYVFLDPIVWLAYRVPRLSSDQLPPLCDYDSAKHLVNRSYQHLDPFSGAKKRSLFFGLVTVFRRSLSYQAVLLIMMAFARFTNPIGTNRLLDYLERNGEEATVRPWVWIVCLAAGPLVEIILFQLYVFFSTCTHIRIGGIITSIVFDHALRIRLKAEVSDTKASSTTERVDIFPTSNTPDSGSTIANDNDEAEDSATTRSKGVLSASASTTTVAAASSSTQAHSKAKCSEVKDAKQMENTLKSKGTNVVGKLNNLVTSDLDNIAKGCDFLMIFIYSPLQIALGIWFLYVILGWSTFVGLAVMVILFPAPAWIASLMGDVQKRKMESTDARVQNVVEVMNVLRMIKLFGWESRVIDDVSTKREDELRWIFKNKMLRLGIDIINHTIPLIHMAVTYATYTLIMKQELKASVIFSSMTAFNTLRSQTFRLFSMIPQMITANVSLERVADFLWNTELLDVFTKENASADPTDRSRDEIGCGHAHFTWTHEPATPSKQTFRLRIDDELAFKKGSFNLIIGPTGSGKTSILMALLGEMHYIPLGPDAWINLPRDGGVALAVQESWVQSETIRENILFGAPYDEERYKTVIYQCGLGRDLSLFEAGDATEVGEKGLTLSGGQKARITLARALYSSAEILLLDDILAALDVHTSRWIVNKCFKGDLIRGRTVLLVTHNVAMASPLADTVVLVGADGRVSIQSSVSAALEKDPELAEAFTHEEEAIELDDDDDDGFKVVKTSDGKLIVSEEVEEGHVGIGAFMLFLRALGGKWPALFWIGYLISNVMSGVCDAFEVWWLGWWAQQYVLRGRGEVYVVYYLTVYSLIVFAAIVFQVSATVTWTYGSVRASRSLHRVLLDSLLRSTFRWLDVTPTSRVVARCTQDIQAVDEDIAQNLESLSDMSVNMLAKIGAVVIYTPTFIVPAIVISALGGYLGQVYMHAQLFVKRERSNARSPLLGIFGEAVAGLASIRAYGAQHAFKEETFKHIDHYVRASRSFFNLNRWIGIRINALSAGFAAVLASYLVYGRGSADPSDVGFVLVMAASFSDMIIWWVRVYNSFEVSGNSLERIQQYLVIEHEPKAEDGGKPPAYWPSSGDIRVKGLSARYSPDGPKVLQDVSFHIKAGQRVGIVGRTGSGKSTLTLALLRCIYTEGTVWYDGVATDSMNLDDLRSNITIIPQMPELLSGTLRHNLDVFGEYDDGVLNDGLRAAGLFSLQRLQDENRLTLDSKIAGAGSNLSVGQRQIIALARAIVRRSKLLILDEATSAIDYETDAVIQGSLRSEIHKDVTVITVAHRLQTIMDSDLIMVLDAGRLVEIDSPQVLLRNGDGLLRALVEESADKETLFAML